MNRACFRLYLFGRIVARWYKYRLHQIALSLSRTTMSTCPALSEFKVLSSRIREIEIALDQVFDELDEAAIAPTSSTLKDLLARRKDLADQLADTNKQLITLSKQQIYKDRAEITKNLAETRKINAEIRQDLEDFYKNVLGCTFFIVSSCRSYLMILQPLQTMPIQVSAAPRTATRL